MTVHSLLFNRIKTSVSRILTELYLDVLVKIVISSTAYLASKGAMEW